VRCVCGLQGRSTVSTNGQIRTKKRLEAKLAVIPGRRGSDDPEISSRFPGLAEPVQSGRALSLPVASNRNDGGEEARMTGRSIVRAHPPPCHGLLEDFGPRHTGFPKRALILSCGCGRVSYRIGLDLRQPLLDWRRLPDECPARTLSKSLGRAASKAPTIRRRPMALLVLPYQFVLRLSSTCVA